MATIVLVVASTTGLSGGDTLIRDRLIAAGHEVVLRNDEDAEYTGSYDGMVIADSSVNATVGSKYDTIAKPGICTESMTAGWRLGSSIGGADATQWTVQNVPAAIGSVATGTRTVYSTTISQQGVTPAGTHTVVAYRGAGSSTNPVYVIWESGASLSSGTAPAKRAFFRLANSAGDSQANGGSVAADGVALLDAAIAWAFGPTVVPPTVDAGADVPSWTVDTEFTRLATVDDGGATTTTEWTITAGPAGVGTTIETDADLAWTPTVTGTYTLEAESTNSAGSDTDTMDITVVAAPTTLRMYLTSTDLSTSVTKPAQASFWDVATTPAVNDAHQLSNVPEGAAEYRGVIETSASQPLDVLIGRWVSGPCSVAGTLLADEVTLTMARGQSTDDTAAVWEWAVRVISAAGTLVGEMTGVFFSTEWPTIAGDPNACVGASTTASAANVDEVSVSTTDRIMVEVGYRVTNTLTTDQQGTIIFGGTSTPDLAPSDTGGSLGRPSWIDLPTSAGLAFTDEAAPTPPSGNAPGEFYDLAQFHLTLPTDSGEGDAAQIDQPELETYEDDNFFLDENNMMVCIAPIEGFTTSGESGATRTELRQREPGSYALTAFDPHTATQRMTLTTYPDPTSIDPDPPGRKEMIIWQIHGASGSPPLLLAAEYHVATPRIRIFKDGPGVSNPVTGITPEDPITIRCIVDNGEVNLWVVLGEVADLASATPTTWDSTEFADDVDWYFKAGAYNKTEIGSGANGGSAIAKISYLELNNVVLGDATQPPSADPFPLMAHFFGGM